MRFAAVRALLPLLFAFHIETQRQHLAAPEGDEPHALLACVLIWPAIVVVVADVVVDVGGGCAPACPYAHARGGGLRSAAIFLFLFVIATAAAATPRLHASERFLNALVMKVLLLVVLVVVKPVVLMALIVYVYERKPVAL